MANTHALFQQYNQKIRLTDEKRSILMVVRDSLRQRMKTNFMKLPEDTRKQLELYFQSQGSIIMDTIITPSNDDFDLDDGVYFQGKVDDKDRPVPSIFHEWVIQAVDKDNTYEEILDKPTCVRVRYKSGFHIDIPIYFVTDQYAPDLAHTKEGWMLSNPVEFIAWFEKIADSGFRKEFIYESLTYAEPFQKWLSDIRKADCQIRRIVRYLKSWADLDRKEMPCGIVMTILVANNIALSERDDLALRDTLVNIKRYLQNNGTKCPRPTSPEGEDLLASTSSKDKQHFLLMLDNIISIANKAINAPDEYAASALWNKVLGPRFPLLSPPAPKVQPNNPTPNIEALRRTASQSTPWSPGKRC